jgi:uncharacterized protein YjbI with pentapeptide repeats
MANPEHVRIVCEGAAAWNKWRGEFPSARPDLRGANLVRADLIGVNFSGTNLDGANLNEALLTSSDFTDASLKDTAFRGAGLNGASFVNANLAWNDFWRADVSNASFARAILAGVNFHQAKLAGATFSENLTAGVVFADNDLSECSGLESMIVTGPCTIGVDSIYRSKGRIPESFLRRCGVPENFIKYMPSLVNSEDGIQFYSCFISYSCKDEEFARRVHGRMRDAHLRVWFAPEDVKGGQKLHEQIDTAIRFYDKLLIVLSEASLRSEWVMTELRKARKAERQTGERKLFPVRLVDYDTLRDWECFDADSGKDLAVELREYFIPDFSNWKDYDQFETAFDRLLKDLRAESRPGRGQ